MCACVSSGPLTRSVVGLVAGVRDLGPQLQVVPGLLIGRAIGTKSEHAASEAGQVAHLPLQVAVLPLADERQAAVGLPDQVALDGLEGVLFETFREKTASD